MIQFAIITFFILIFALGVICGKYSERIAWNRLIERGVLPKPKGSKKNVDFDFFEGEDF